jgi:DNA helicase-2/ATP-dependent DNA helicase PcrA
MIEFHPDAPEGFVIERSSWTSLDIDIDDAILCRNTAPLVGVAFSLILKHKPARMLGREIGQGLSALVKKLKPKTIEELGDKLLVYQRSKIHELTEKGHESKVQAVLDKCECVRTFAANAESIDALHDQIKSMFADKSHAVTLSTIHKAKGLEWNKVFILNRWLMPSKWATQPWQQRQEAHLQYVAITRAKLDLVYITTEGYGN